MYNVKIKNCNNVKEGTIQIEQGKLNIKYGINGTGKTTIAKALQYSLEGETLQGLQSYYSERPAEVEVEPAFHKVLVFNDEFVNQVVFIDNEVIEKPFEVFLKTPDYDERKEQLELHLKELTDTIIEDEEVVELKEKLIALNRSFARTPTGKLKNSGALKSLLSKKNLYNIPEELDSYVPFLLNNDNNIAWIDWVNRGEVFDTINCCPYCTEEMNIEEHKRKQNVFKQVYTKSESQNLKEVLELIEGAKDYMSEEKYTELITYIKSDTGEDVIKAIVQKLTAEMDLIIIRLEAICSFGRRKIAVANISNLDKQILEMEIPVGLFEIFRGERIKKIFKKINEKVSYLKEEVLSLKREMGELKGLLLATVRSSENDINAFLKTAGINYEIKIDTEDETNSRTVLKQCFSEQKTDVENIRQHLSWGERNAFSLILFMYYAQMQNADLIILDDPISSFDSNKKFAILHRMFKGLGRQGISLTNKTVLLLTHDFEPITDFVVVGKLKQECVTSSFIWNEDGTVRERKIDSDHDINSLMEECRDIAKNTNVNIVSRVAFLRKLCELNGRIGEWDSAYQILSCLVHVSPIQRKVGNEIYESMDQDEVEEGLEKIKEYISDFDFDALKENVYCIDEIKNLFWKEENNYFKVQLFREMCEIEKGKIGLAENDEGWYKFIDETYHIENDLLHYLDIMKFNIVPNYIISKVKEIVSKL